ncbi:hypothetical protein DNTS_014111 [Danionella cerebrum]|uniref:CUB domain-containing protein n=1 Tax=Danionella cerebrum TaxID=2873325 RepID=A0A553NKQ8_9TELE|nr:hypothetical protein DNTS_014111 [Danionella translucida]
MFSGRKSVVVKINHTSPLVFAEPCGGHLDASDAGYITTPGYPLEYPPHQNCRWVITAPEQSQRIVLNFNPHFELEKLDCSINFSEAFVESVFSEHFQRQRESEREIKREGRESLNYLHCASYSVVCDYHEDDTNLMLDRSSLDAVADD